MFKLNKLRTALITVGVVVPFIANAGIYINGNIGFVNKPKNNVDDVKISDVPSLIGIINSVENKSGYRAGIALGYKKDALRGEIEFTHIRNNLKDAKFTKNDTPAPGAEFFQKFDKGNNRVNALMANVFYDMDNMVSDGITPYVGVGVGGASVETTIDFKGNSNENNYKFKKNVVAGQVIAGMNITITKNILANADYRYIVTGATDTGNKFSAHIANLGFTYRVNT